MILSTSLVSRRLHRLGQRSLHNRNKNHRHGGCNLVEHKIPLRLLLEERSNGFVSVARMPKARSHLLRKKGMAAE